MLLKFDGFDIGSGGRGKSESPALLFLIPGNEEVLGQDLPGFPFSLCQEKLLDIRGKRNH